MTRLLVTGGFGVLGRAIGVAAKAAGADVALIGRAATAPAGLDPEICYPGVDVADETSVTRCVEALAAKWGGLDGLFNVAGAFRWSRVEHAPPRLWEDLYRANVLSAVAATRAVAPHLRAGGLVVNVAAAAASRASAGMGPYTAAKAGVLRLTEALAEEWAPRSIRVYSVSPTILDTPDNRASMVGVDTSGWIAPSDMAKAMLHLFTADMPSGADILIGLA